jgi:hypothetical protein
LLCCAPLWASEPADVAVTGAFGPLFDWPLIPIHVSLLPDGRVLGYGTDARGEQGAALYYAIWNPSRGYGADAFTLVPNATRSNLFCGSQLVLPGSGDVLMVGGGRLDQYRQRNSGSYDVNLFSTLYDVLTRQSESLNFARWYATLLTLGNGRQLVVGGLADRGAPAMGEIPPGPSTYSPIPEMLSADGQWQSLPGAQSAEAYGDALSYSYPRAWQAPGGKVFVLGRNAHSYWVGLTGAGSIREAGDPALPLPIAWGALPAVMYAPGKILSLRNYGKALTVDINGAAPVAQSIAPAGAVRYDGNATVLADGRAWINGGSAKRNDPAQAPAESQLWDPATGAWTMAAAGAKLRLYHSSALLLADATVLVGGGGAPGPTTNLDGEIYTPPYLFRSDGTLAPRPSITSAPQRIIGWDEAFDVTLAGADALSRVTLLRTGASTHGLNNEQRFMELPFVQDGVTLHLHMPASHTIAPPGYYLLFVIDADGVPSVARVLRLG